MKIFSLSDIKIENVKTASKKVIPLVENLPAGAYSSVIKSIDVMPQYEKAVSVEHNLTSTDGKSFFTSFCFFNTGVDRLIEDLALSGYRGRLQDIAGFAETVVIKHGKKYAYIASRQASADVDATPEVSAETPEESQDEAKPKPKRGLTSYRRRTPPVRSKASELLEDEEEEFDDFADFDDYDEG